MNRWWRRSPSVLEPIAVPVSHHQQRQPSPKIHEKPSVIERKTWGSKDCSGREKRVLGLSYNSNIEVGEAKTEGERGEGINSIWRGLGLGRAPSVLFLFLFFLFGWGCVVA